jgi:diaminohydroxyphosphoribosylaminopyrimidine deaminase / 5-amino-6-(5-phosphoribosylamino)uracil reductase
MTPPTPFMQLALDSARSVRGTTSPNPWVGAVLVRDGHIIATGATEPPGGRHAEAAALVATTAVGADLYVTLEPCAPFPGKRTRPCAEAVIEAGVRRVFIALQDPDPNIQGRGIAMLRDAGLEVTVGDGRDQAIDLLRPYLKHRQARLPYVIAKFAASLDGRSATPGGDSRWITGEDARDLGHQQRAWVDAIMVGSGTVLADDPALTARPSGRLATHQPVRVVLDSRGRIPASSALFAQPGHAIVATTCDASLEWKRAITGTGAQVLECEREDAGLNLDQLLAALGDRGIMSIWAEGGATLLGSLFDSGNVDEVWAFIAPLIIGGDGPGAVRGRGVDLVSRAWALQQPVIQQVGRDILVRGYTENWSP